MLNLQRPTIYQTNGNFMTILMDLSDLRFYLCKRGKIQFYQDHFLCKSHYTMVNNKKSGLTLTKLFHPIKVAISNLQSSANFSFNFHGFGI